MPGPIQYKKIEPEDQLKKSMNMVSANFPEYLRMADNYIKNHFEDEDVNHRRDAHKLMHKFIDKVFPNITKVEHSGDIDPILQQQLMGLLKMNASKEIPLEIVQDVEEPSGDDEQSLEDIVKGLK